MMKHNASSRTRQAPVNQDVNTRPINAGDAGILYSEDLFSRGRTVAIIHNGECYTLRLTAANKLLLTK